MYPVCVCVEERGGGREMKATCLPTCQEVFYSERSYDCHCQHKAHFKVRDYCREIQAMEANIPSIQEVDAANLGA